jgi:hypothetical protein
MNFAGATGDTRPASGLITSICESCRQMLDKIDSVYAHGGEFRGNGWRVLQIRYQPFQPRNKPVLSVGIKVYPQVMIERSGKDPVRFEGGRNQLNLTLVWRDSLWRVTRLERLS